MAHDALLKVVASFAVQLNSTLWYEEVDFCVLEFLREALRRRDRVATTEEPFEYASAESDEAWLPRAAKGAGGRWYFESPSAMYPDSAGASDEEVVAAITELADVLHGTLPARDEVVALLGRDHANVDLIEVLVPRR